MSLSRLRGRAHTTYPERGEVVGSRETPETPGGSGSRVNIATEFAYPNHTRTKVDSNAPGLL